MKKLGAQDDLVVVAGAGGFIGGHLIADLRRQGYRRLRGVDIKPFDEWYQHFPDVDNHVLDLRRHDACETTMRGARLAFNLACDMGGMGFIETHKAECMISVLINTHMLMAARDHKAQRVFYSSSACVYAADKQTTADVPPLKEADAYPAMPEDGYGWEKLFGERMCRHFTEDFGLETRVAGQRLNHPGVAMEDEFLENLGRRPRIGRNRHRRLVFFHQTPGQICPLGRPGREPPLQYRATVGKDRASNCVHER